MAGIAVTALGHGDAGVMQAMQEAMSTGLLHTSNLYRTAPGEHLADWLVAHSFASRVFFCNSGAEANEGAFKFARRWARADRRAGEARDHRACAAPSTAACPARSRPPTGRRIACRSAR